MMLQSEGPSVGQLLVILLGSIPILGIMGWTAVKILGPIGQAISRRIAAGRTGSFSSGGWNRCPPTSSR